MTPAAAPHVPVLLDEVIAGLAIREEEIHVDGTFGAGGYTNAMLGLGARVYAFDRDPDAVREGSRLADVSGGRLTLVPERFSRMRQALADRGVEEVDGVTLDIGVSSMQLDQADRGFSFQGDGPLDMRMSQEGESAADFLNKADEGEIADVIYKYGEEPKSRRIARAIVAARPIERTGQLAQIVRKALGWHAGMKKDPATRTFQAIRIHLNEELEELEGGLEAAEQILKEGGRLAVVTFHSLEDRVVKRFLRERSGSVPAASRHFPAVPDEGPKPTFEAVAKPVKAGEAELAANPRARSATLRVARRTSAPPRSRKGFRS
nr:16S rRNA (cytosine(1402)-N(4))-methyltransferase RsmH [uncultured Sphingosinicella sp.]